MLAYITIGLNSNKENELYEELKKLPNIKDVHIVFGEWDVVALAEVDSAEHLATFVMDKIRVHPEVELTSTMIVAK